MSTAVKNDGNHIPAKYHRYNSSQEIVLQSLSIDVIDNMTLPPSNACVGIGSNGVNAARQAPPSFAHIQSLMDSVRFQRTPKERQYAYQGQIILYFADQGNISALEQYAATLPVSNRAATYTFNLYLVRAYAGRHLLQQSHRARQQLLALAVGDANLQQELAWLDLLPSANNWPSAGVRLPTADSLVLHRIATSGTSVAENAATWLRYYYPHAAPYRGPRLLPVARLAASLPDNTLLIEGGLYPNPAAATAVARYRVARTGQTIELQVFSLLTGLQVLGQRLPLIGNRDYAGEHTVDMTHLNAGQYSYRFVVNGKAQSVHHLIIQK